MLVRARGVVYFIEAFMSDKKMDNKSGKKNDKLFIFGVLIALGLLALGLMMSTPAPKSPEQETEQASSVMGDIEAPPMPEVKAQPEEQTISSPEQRPAYSGPPVTSVDVNAALSDRILGNPSAPVKISEHASLTCSHCGHFHRDTFDKLKQSYVDTGKAYLVYSDFPLGEPALKASMVARCLPQERYFDFIHMLFQTQDEWAFTEKYLDILKTKAGENGLTPEAFDACINNAEIKAGIENRMKAVAEQWKINSTPSFVINNKITISGAESYENFAKIIDEELFKSGVVTDETPADPAAKEGAAEHPLTPRVLPSPPEEGEDASE